MISIVIAVVKHQVIALFVEEIEASGIILLLCLFAPAEQTHLTMEFLRIALSVRVLVVIALLSI